ncbi:MAG: PIN domain-containing protein [Candidatus Acidiferrum sp.]
MDQAKVQPHGSLPPGRIRRDDNLPLPVQEISANCEARGQNWDFWAIRITLLTATSILCYTFPPFGIHGLAAAGLGFLVALIILLAELRLRRAEISGLVGGICGAVVGLLASLLFTLIISRTAEPEPTKSFLEFTSLFAFGYLGLVVGSSKGSAFRDRALPATTSLPSTPLTPMKLLDTSALIDGRIADICETHFLDGTLGVPRFVLVELQQVADSTDGLRRQRGRRGLEVLERMQKMSWLDLRIVNEDVPALGAVDQKLIELARTSGSKIVTNDFNLNKVARVQGISILNVNELANAVKPAVLPGETMRVLVLKEGKESTQGIAYLDDGTMVVIDGARRHINRTIDIVVTSTHQTPAGKMIFGRMDERGDNSASRAAAAGEIQNNAPVAPSSRFTAGSSPYTGREPL